MKYNIPLPAVPFAVSSVRNRSEGFGLLIEGRADNCAVPYVPDDRNFVQRSSKKSGGEKEQNPFLCSSHSTRPLPPWDLLLRGPTLSPRAKNQADGQKPREQLRSTSLVTLTPASPALRMHSILRITSLVYFLPFVLLKQYVFVLWSISK